MKVYKRSPRRMKVCKGRPVAGVGEHTISLYCAPLREHTISLYCAPLQESVNTHTQVYRPRHYKSTMPRGAPPGNQNGATAHKVAICDNTRIATAASSPAVVNGCEVCRSCVVAHSTGSFCIAVALDCKDYATGGNKLRNPRTFF